MIKMTDVRLQQSYRYSVDVIKEHSKSFYQGFRMLPEEKFLAVASIYGFCRTADDVVDEGEDDQEDRVLGKLKSLKDDILRLHCDHPVENDHLWWDAFSHTVKNYDIPPTGFLMQLEGQRMDLYFEDIQTIDDLIDYSRHVAGSVGRMLLPLLVEDEDERQREDLATACEDLGIAMQITNILRDVGEDLRELNRVYLPARLLEKYELTKDRLREFFHEREHHDAFPRFVRLWEELADVSDQYYEQFNDHLCTLDQDARFPVYGSSLIYRSIMDEVRENDYNCFTKRNYTSKGTKLRLLTEAKRFIKEKCG